MKLRERVAEKNKEEIRNGEKNKEERVCLVE